MERENTGSHRKAMIAMKAVFEEEINTKPMNYRLYSWAHQGITSRPIIQDKIENNLKTR